MGFPFFRGGRKEDPVSIPTKGVDLAQIPQEYPHANVVAYYSRDKKPLDEIRGDLVVQFKGDESTINDVLGRIDQARKERLDRESGTKVQT